VSIFEDFAGRKTRAAATARIERLATVFDVRDAARTRGVGNAWSETHYGGEFGLVVPAEARTALSLVFIQSKDGNTGGLDPEAFGGGATDKHLIYEGLSRVAADAVLAGAGSIHADAFFSVWHPELVALRASLCRGRHPAQIVVSKRGLLDLDALLFNVSIVRVFLIAGNECLERHAPALRARPWIRVVPLSGDDLRSALDHLRIEEGIQRISAVGGRFTATRLVDAGLAQDSYLTTTVHAGGEAGTPWYSGASPPRLIVLTKKQWMDGASRVLFEHLLLTNERRRSPESTRRPRRRRSRAPGPQRRS
jgi:riboflavin biosynthesis pyrimidine reductase